MAISDHSSPSPEGHKATEFGGEGYYNGFSGADAEKQQSNSNAGRKMSRIDRPVTKSISGNIAGRQSIDGDMESEQSVSVGKQMEMEAGNAIKYRTCSWPKVGFEIYCFPAMRWVYGLMHFSRPQHCCSASTFLWLSCHSRTRTHISGWCRASS